MLQQPSHVSLFTNHVFSSCRIPFYFSLRMEHVPPGDPVLKLVCGSQEPGDFLLVRRVAICVSDHEPNSRTQDKLDDDVRGAGRSPSQTRHCRASWVWLSLELLLHNSFFCIPHFDISSDIAGCTRSVCSPQSTLAVLQPGQRPLLQLYNTRAPNCGQHRVAK